MNDDSAGAPRAPANAGGGPRGITSRRLAGIFGGSALFATMLVLPPPEGLESAAWRVAALAALMAIWWMTEAIPVAATALLPIALFPLLRVSGVTEAAAPYGNPLIFLFLGGFVIARAVERWNLHRRIALAVLAAVGTRPDRLIGGFMLATAGLSMWVSNTATAVMMLPIGLSVIGLLHTDEGQTKPGTREDRFALALLLGIAYSASIGGLATLIGTPPNALLAGFMQQTYGVTVGFFQWMLVGVPVSAVMLGTAWLLLTRILFRHALPGIEGAETLIAGEIAKLGPMRREEKRVVAVFVCVALLWVFRPLLAHWLPLTDPGIAVLGALAMFLVPADLGRGVFLLDWDHAKRLPWGILLLFGGGLSLARAIDDSGLAAWIGELLTACAGWPTVAIVLLITALVVFLTELTSNTATAAVFLPVVASLGLCIGHNPLLFAVPAALAASCAFMMPVATPPNAIVFGSGMVTVPQMARAGFLLNLAAILVIVLATYSLVLLVFGVEPGIVPEWAIRAHS
jgi:sodium-dependent dicarboxylate transporter 2/3/5